MGSGRRLRTKSETTWRKGERSVWVEWIKVCVLHPTLCGMEDHLLFFRKVTIDISLEQAYTNHEMNTASVSEATKGIRVTAADSWRHDE